MRITRIQHADHSTVAAIPIYLSQVRAGFPSPADDYIDGKLDLNERYIKNAPATFCVTVEGDSMIEAGINSGDMLIVDRSLTPADNCIVIACLEGELTVKRLRIRRGKVMLLAGNPAFPSIEIKRDDNLVIWGVVTTVIRSLRPR